MVFCVQAPACTVPRNGSSAAVTTAVPPQSGPLASSCTTWCAGTSPSSATNRSSVPRSTSAGSSRPVSTLYPFCTASVEPYTFRMDSWCLVIPSRFDLVFSQSLFVYGCTRLAVVPLHTRLYNICFVKVNGVVHSASTVSPLSLRSVRRPDPPVPVAVAICAPHPGGDPRARMDACGRPQEHGFGRHPRTVRPRGADLGGPELHGKPRQHLMITPP